MGKHGPCYHCGVTSTPLWRNGPPEKPVLCNACGSRWRTKGTLVNYTPLHKRDVLELEVPKRPKEKSSFLTLKVKNLPKGQWSNRIVEAESGIGEYGQSFLKGIDEDTSNRSSSGSAMSFSESCANFLGADASEETGSFQSNAWETIVPSRKRTGVIRPKRSAVEKLTMDLHSIMHEQSSYMTVSSEEDLLYESNTSTGLIEIGNGSVLIRHPNSALIEEESEASSLPMQNKSYSTGLSLMMDCQSEIPSASNARDAKIKNTPAQEQSKRDRASSEKLHILQNKDSKLGFIDLGDIVCFEGYMKHLTDQERQQLMRYLPSVDTTNFPESLETMFTSPQFVESLSCFQDLLRQGIFNLSTSMLKFDDCKNLRKLILSNVTKCVWAESFKIFKDAKHDTKQSRKGGHCGTTFLGSSSTISLKRPHESHNDNFAEPKVASKNLKKLYKTASSSIPSTRFVKDATGELEKKPKIESYDHKKSDGLIGSPETLCAPPKRSFIFDSLQPTDCSLEEDLLLDVRSSTSFPEAELLSNAWLPNLPGQRFCGESGVSTKEGSLLCQSAVSFTGDMP